MILYNKSKPPSRHLEVFCCSRGCPPCPPDQPNLPITCLPSNLLSELLTHLALTHLGQLPSHQLHLPGLALHLLLQVPAVSDTPPSQPYTTLEST